MSKLVLRTTLFVFFLGMYGYTATKTITETITKTTAVTETNNGLKKLFPNGLLNAAGEVVELDILKGKVIGVYFSAHWCSPCQSFTPKLVKYRDENKDKFEVVFISSDRSKKAKQEYMNKSKMNWLTLPWRSPTANALVQKFEKTEIPFLVLLNDKGALLTKEGHSLISRDINIDKLHTVREIYEKYKCGRCKKIHVRKKLVYGDESK